MHTGRNIRLSALALLCALAGACGPSTPPLSESAQRGEQAFATHCGSCHAMGDSGSESLSGPWLVGVMGRRAGSTSFPYSPAMRAAGETIVWERETLERFLAAPRDVVPNNQMAFFGIPDAATRADIVEFLAAKSPN
jgi:cytochrome c